MKRSAFQKAFGVDKKRLEEGRWIPFEGMKFLIASSRKKAFLDAFADVQRRFPGVLLKTPDADKAYWKAVAEHLLLNWEGVDDDAGNPLPYSVKAAAHLLETEPLFLEFVVGCANKEAFFLAENEEEDLGN